MSFFKKYKYLVGGLVYSLEDIEHGILRKNDNFNTSLLSLISFYFKGRGNGTRFLKNDPRRKFILEEVDPRIHFALNCGAKSCPPILVYEEDDLDAELDIATRNFCGDVNIN